MNRLVIGLVMVAIAVLAVGGTAYGQAKPEFKLGFKALAEQIPNVVGQPAEEEHYGPNGDSLQQTTTGLMVWRKADNWTAFTDGGRTWINGPDGLQARANPVRFAWEPPYVRPILFVPMGLSPHPDDAENVDKVMKRVQDFYAAQLGGKTFLYSNVEVIRGQHELKFYCPKTRDEKQCIQDPGKVGADPGDINNVLNDIESQGLNAFGNRQVVLIFWVGGYGYAGGSKRSEYSGQAALGDWSLDGIGSRYSKGTATGGCYASPFAYAFCRDDPNGQPVIHELGHAFGVPHPSTEGATPGDPNHWTLSIMDGCEWPNCKFLDSTASPEKQTLLKSPFFTPVNSGSSEIQLPPASATAEPVESPRETVRLTVPLGYSIKNNSVGISKTLISIDVLSDGRLRINERVRNESGYDWPGWYRENNGRDLYILDSSGNRYTPTAWGTVQGRRPFGPAGILKIGANQELEYWVLFPPLKDVSSKFGLFDDVEFKDVSVSR